jgi:hypothetical protein
MRMSELHAETANQGYVVEYKIVTEKVDLRDQFAMAALTGIVGHPQPLEGCAEYARLAYEFADAMLKARESK